MTAVSSGSWVEIERVVLEAGERAPGLPEDTAGVPLVLRVAGFLVDDADVGQPARVRTAVGRVLAGTLTTVNPGYAHSFGDTVPELSAIGRELLDGGIR